MDTRTSPIRMRLAQLREELARRGIDALLVPSSDPHLSEYLPERWQGRVVAVGLHRLDGHAGGHAATRAALFADSRYWVQAEAELAGSGIELVQIHTAASPRAPRLAGRAGAARRQRRGRRPGARPGRGAGAAARGSTPPASRCAPTPDLLDAIWPERPALPRAAGLRAPARRMRRARAPPSWRRCARRWRAHGATHHFVSTVDDIAWLTNLRGGDVDYNPVFLAHLLLDATGARAVRRRRQGRRRAARRAGRRRHRARALRRGRRRAGRAARRATCCCSTRSASRWAFASRWAAAAASSRPSTRARCSRAARPRPRPRFMREAMAEDGAAMCEFYAWFEAALARGERLTELTIDEQLQRRARTPHRLRRPELFHHRRASTPTARCRTTAPRPSRIAADRGRRPAADRLRRRSTSAAPPTSRACGRSATSARR